MQVQRRWVVLGILAAALTAPAAASAQGSVVVSEVQTGGIGSDTTVEFVELVNRSVASVDISGWTVHRHADSECVLTPAASDTMPAGTVLQPGQHYLLGPPAIAVTPDQTFSNPEADALPFDNGAVELVDASDTTRDLVGYGDGVFPACVETASTLAPPGAGSSERLGAMQDTDNNRADFVTRNISDPNNSSTIEDRDLDGARDNVDNCIATSNPSQGDADGDGIGDACDPTPNPPPPPDAPVPPPPGPPATPPAQVAQDLGPAEVQELRFEPARPRVGQTARLILTARDPLAGMLGLSFDTGERRGRFGEMACQLVPFSPEFDPGRATTFEVETVFRSPGVHEVEVSIFSGGCAPAPSVTRRTITVDVAPAANARVSSRDRAPGGAQRSQSACRDATLAPTRRNLVRIERATLCLMNAERRKARRRPLRSSGRLRRTARGHSSDMLRRRFFAHMNLVGPTLKQRLRRGRYRGRPAGENIGFDSIGTAERMMAAWMASPPHRANILSPRYRFAGIGLLAGKPIQSRLPGATYTVNFGSRAR